MKSKKILSTIRYVESAIFAAPAVMGVLIHFPGVKIDAILRALIATTGSYFLVAFVFAINDWADIGVDRLSARKTATTFLQKGVSRTEMLGVSVVLAALGTGMLASLSLWQAVLSVAVVVFGVAYSYPIFGIQGKGVPFLSSGLHFATMLFLFVIGAETFGPTDGRGLLIGSYLALLITAGHLVQEVQDLEGDQLSNTLTHAVRYGPRTAFAASITLFTLSFVQLLGMALAGVVPRSLAWLCLLYPAYVWMALRSLRAGLDSETVQSFRFRYRILFGVIIATLTAAAAGSFMLPS